MKYVIVYGQELGYAIGEIEAFDTQEEAEKVLQKEIRENKKHWKKFWIQQEFICA